MNLFDFMGMHPVLTFVLALVLTDCVVRTAAAIRGYYYADHCDNCNCEDEE